MKMLKYSLSALPMLLAAAAFPVYAEEGPGRDDLRLADHDRAIIIVTGSGNLPPSSSDGVVAQQWLTSLDQGMGHRVENSLRDAAGLVQFRRSDGRSAHPTSQGITLRGLGGNASSRALVMLDGVPQADPFGGWVAWSAYDAIRLGGIAISRGGGSGVEGAGALAGTIGLHSAMTKGAEASLAYGSRDSWDASLNFGGNIGAGEVAIDGRYSRGDGFIPIVKGQRGAVDRAAAYQQGGVGLRARFDAGAHSRIEASVRAFRDERDRGVDYSESRIDGVDASLRMVQEAPDTAQWSALAYVQVRELESGFASVGAGRATVAPVLFQHVPATGLGARVELRPLISDSHPLRLGADWRRTVGRTNEDYFYSGLVPGRRRVAGGSSDVVGLFAEWTGEAADHALIWTLSGRVDRWWIGNGYRRESNNGGGMIADEDFSARSGWEGSGRAGLSWQSGGMTLRGAAYRGWRLPTLNELYRPFRVGAAATAANEHLSPERLWGADLGMDWQADRLRLSVTAFANRLSGAIANVTPGGIGINSRRENLDAIVSKGMEFSGSYDLGALAAQWSYAFTDAEVKASGIAAHMDGKRPAQIARHGASFALRSQPELPFGGFTVLRYVSAQNEDDLGEQKLKQAFTVDAGLNWRWNEKISLEVRAENLLDELVMAAISADGLVERAMPRSLWLGVRFAL
ncbi:MAG TPA: TonB-dependent receptor [Sphingopyxis sp.]|nr:TonB-dependent receptor [Sphingopyxis sp.]